MYRYRQLKQPGEIRLLGIHLSEDCSAVSCQIYHRRIPWPYNAEREKRFKELSSLCREGKLPLLEMVRFRSTWAAYYEAVSYTWGDPHDRIDLMCFDDQNKTGTISVTKHCYRALKALGKDRAGRGFIWIDSVCINQMDEMERGSQVQMMRYIYSYAYGVAIYLGDGSEEESCLWDLDGSLRFDSRASFGYYLADRPNIGKLLDHPWFTRVWVLQEIKAARHAKVICGQYTVSWREFESAYRYWHGGNTVLNQFLSLTRVWGDEQMDPATILFQRLCESRYCGATDPRDKVYALLGLLPQGMADLIHVDYTKSVTQVYVATASLLVKTIGLTILSAVQGTSSIDDLPSWVPDWTLPFQQTVLGFHLESSPDSSSKLCRDAKIIRLPSFAQFSKFEDLPEYQGILISSHDNNGLAPSLQVRGVRLASITRLGDSCITTDYSKSDWQHIVFEQWRQIALKSLPSDAGKLKKSIRESLYICTISMDADFDFSEMEDMTDNVAAFDHSCHNSFYQKSIWARCKNRKFYVATGDYLGLAPLEAHTGDIVCAFVGGVVPFLVRPEAGKFRFIGECYIQGGKAHPLVQHISRTWSAQQSREPNAPFEDFVLV
ncbi:HET-domain-containing protein [Lophiostoma macrostomum CBS 122681]|uniref:HET-domain-containing protein n=1 Tax=Lophiostoma macrostomum CBS 122681 TaxID=1314788 RepID=A0A6A6SLF8_9PLEO|nr:HET-domain-containing protein [Lophiostoma macrostomum CBS 122681]